MNNDLISREALKDATKQLCNETLDGIVKFGIEKVYDLIDNAPTVEEVSVIEFKEPLPLVKAQKIVKTLSKRPQGEYIRKEDVIALLNKWADGYSYIEIPTEDAIKEIINFTGMKEETND